MKPSGPHVPSGPSPLDELRAEVLAAAEELSGGRVSGGDGGGAGGRRPITLERPPRRDFGDYSTNAALLLAPGLGLSPQEVAERLGEELRGRLGERLERVEVAGPGFLNLFLSDRWVIAALAGVLAAGESFGAGRAAHPERILVEFVSANPTGPLHVGHARNAAYGDSLARLLTYQGHDVDREFYVNDAGSQVKKLGESILALSRGEPVPEDGYQGAYVEQLVSLAADDGGDPAQLGRAAVAVIVRQMEASLEAFAVKGFDRWAYESAMHEGEPGRVSETLQTLEQQGRTYRSEGALWLRTTDYGDDKDRVLIRSNGEHTYFASDIAYHQDKRERGFTRQIDVWGADHHGYVVRMKAAFEALGGDPSHLELLIMQLVHLLRSGTRAQMSKRAGEFVTLDDLIGEIGTDAARWFLLARSHDTTVDLDLTLAREQSSENPVYYVQYAHARIASLLDRAGSSDAAGAAAGDSPPTPGSLAELELGPLHPSERVLVEQLIAFPGEVSEAADRRAPHRIVAYVLELAQLFTAFYRDCRVIGAEERGAEAFRIALCMATRVTIARSLELLGVSAPEEM